MPSMQPRASWGVVGFVAIGVLWACGSTPEVTGVSTDASADASADSGTDAGTSTPGFGALDGSMEADASCTASVSSSKAEALLQPADIIIAVDTSGSMSEEALMVQQALNSFVQVITSSKIDTRVVLIADASVCIPAPLGSGTCGGADENLPGYRHVVQGVGSDDALSVILDTFPRWKDSLRAGATKTVAVVTDDDSGMAGAAFTSGLAALDPTFASFKFDAIVGLQGPEACLTCFSNCAACANPCCDKAQSCAPINAARGEVYEQLVQQTSGVVGNLCLQNFDPVFQDMAKAVVTRTKISCEYGIPTPSDGQAVDPGLINVSHTTAGGTKTTIPNIPEGGAGCDASGGWHFDNPAAPQKIVFCKDTCDAVQNEGDSVEVQFGCPTEVRSPK